MTSVPFSPMVAPTSVKKLGGTGAGQFWFDTSGFERLPAFTRRANPLYYDDLRGPSFSNVDAILSKNVYVAEGVKIQARLEAYNALNKLNWANPELNVTRLNFGVTNAPVRDIGFGRRLQHALRVEF